jgi:peroxiredoxin
LRASIVFIVFAFALAAQQPEPGLAVGSRIPAFSAQDQNSASQTFDSIKGPKGAMLVFYRSADWCPFCKAQLLELQQNMDLLKQHGLGLAAISYDSVAILKSFADRKNITFPLLADPDSKIIRAFGILNETVPKDSGVYGIPYPLTYMVSPEGVIVSRIVDEDFRQRYTVGDILSGKLPVRNPATQAEAQTKHLKLTTSASDAVIRPGERVRLLIDIEMKPLMHVYAPGVEGYIPIAWKMAESAGFAVKDVEFSESHKLHLAAIDETVPVFQGKFTLQREIVIGQPKDLMPALKEGKELVVEGTLRYQACDDRMCYLPQNVPLKWTFRFEPLDTQRSPVQIQHKLGPSTK